jgi:hypothetical protein
MVSLTIIDRSGFVLLGYLLQSICAISVNFQRLSYMHAALLGHPDLHKDVFIEPTFSSGAEASHYVDELLTLMT